MSMKSAFTFQCDSGWVTGLGHGRVGRSKARSPMICSAGHGGMGDGHAVVFASAGRRRPARGRNGKPARRTGGSSKSAGDPILDDHDIDMTSIRTFVTCPNCANSLMLAPEAFLPEGASKVMSLRCNVCESRVRARLGDLESIDGTPFPAEQFLMAAAAAVETGARERSKLDAENTEYADLE
jgi:hypothetical protein